MIDKHLLRHGRKLAFKAMPRRASANAASMPVFGPLSTDEGPFPAIPLLAAIGAPGIGLFGSVDAGSPRLSPPLAALRIREGSQGRIYAIREHFDRRRRGPRGIA